MEFYPSMTPRWVTQGDGSFELQILATEKHVLAVENLPDVRGYSTKDLFVPHPTKKGLWKMWAFFFLSSLVILWGANGFRSIGRADDVLILANGEKIVPGPTEGTLLAHPAVQGVIMFGRERSQAGLLVEPAEHRAFDPLKDEMALVAFRNEIWPAVEEANRMAPAFARIFKEMILVTSPSKPLPRAAKGTVNRRAALVHYENEIHALWVHPFDTLLY
jgi:acyl-CoA synthetase (AMP-forming)/AMP-acid ligase II